MKYLAYSLISLLSFLVTTKERTINNKPFGVIDDSFEVNALGSYNHIIPIHVPPGINNLTPSLAIAYDSRSGESPFGKGWNLTGLSKITRAGITFKQNNFSEGLTFTGTDNFLLDGQYLTLIKGVNGKDGARYRTENENFFNIAAEGQLGDNSMASPRLFYIKQPNGLTYYYGGADGAVVKLDIGNRKEGLEWNVTRIEDQYGNYIIFEYELNNNRSRIKTIKYTGSKKEEPSNEISFVYETKANYRNVSVLKGNVLFDDQNIKWIHISAHGERFKYYHFEWDNQNGKILSISECSDENRSSCLGTTKIEYNKSEANNSLFQKKEIRFDKLNGRASNLYFEHDINNNGKTEYLLLKGKKQTGNTESKREFSLEVFKGNEYSASTNDTLLVIQDFVTFTSDLPVNNYAIEFIDFNGDGLSDILTENAIWINVSSRKKIEFNPISFGQTEAKNIISTYTRRIPIDLEGDGRSELLAFNPLRQDHLLIRLNPGNKQVEVKKYTNRTFSALQKISFDGVREQILLLQDKPFDPAKTNQRVILNTWEKGLEITDWKQSIPIPGRSFLPLATTITSDMLMCSDVNFDGLTDLIIQPKNSATKAIVFWLNNGTPDFKDEDRYFGHSNFNYNKDIFLDIGAFTSTEKLEILEIKKDSMPNFYVHAIHFNNQLAVSSQTQKFKLPSLTDLKWEKLINSNIKIQFNDLNGDQFFDVRINNELTNSTQANVIFGRTEYLSQHVYPDLLKSVVDGLGNIVKVQYAVTKGDNSLYTVNQNFQDSLEHHPNYKILHYPLTVVKRVSYSNGLRKDSLNTTAYQYTDLLIETKGRGLSGFRSVTKSDEVSKITTATTYEFEFPYTGKIKTQTKSILNGKPFYKQSNSWNYLCFKDGLPCATQLKLSDIDAATKSISYLPVLEATVVTNWELDGTFVSKSSLTYTYSNDGQIIKSVNYFQDGSIITNEKTYQDYLNRPWLKSGIYLKGLVTEERTYPDNDRSKLRHVTYAYYTDKSNDEKGGLKLKIRQPGNPQIEFRTTYLYDNFGNTIEKNENGLVTKYSYDAIGQFLKKKEVVLSNTNRHTTQYEFEPCYGNLEKEIDPNNNWVIKKYDSFGKLHTVKHKDGRFEKYKFEYLTDSKDLVFGSNSTALYKLTTQASGSNPVYQYFDQQGREVGTLYNLIDSTYVQQENMGTDKIKRNTINRYVFKLNEYDARGYLVKDYHPRYVQFIKTEVLPRNQTNSIISGVSNTSICYKFENADNLWFTTHEYDDFGRLIEVENADGIKFTTAYAANKKIEFNGKGQRKTTVYTPRSEIAAVYDDANAAIKYTYDAWRNLTAIAMPDGSLIQTEFDVLGRKIRMRDPNLGEIHYTYDAFDRLKTETSGSREIVLEYDLLGRVVRKIVDKKDTLFWVYDTRKKGHVSLETDVHKNTREYFYDSLSRLSKMQHTLNGKIYFTEVEYDSLSRLRYKSYDGIYKIGYLYSNNIQIGIEEVSTGNSNTLLSVEALNAYGNVTHKRYGNGVHTSMTYFGVSGLLQGIQSQKKSFDFTAPLKECSLALNADPVPITLDLSTRPRSLPFPITNPLSPFNPTDPFNPNNPSFPWTDPSRAEKLKALALQNKVNKSVIDDKMLQHYSYRYDSNYNIALLDDIQYAIKKGYTYDNLNRLTKYENSNAIQDPLVIKYDQVGNITYKSDVGTYEYVNSKSNQVSYIYNSGTIKKKFSYDQYGNITEESISGLKISYTSFNKPFVIQKGLVSDSIWYGSDNQEVYRKKYSNDSTLASATLRPFDDMEIEKGSDGEVRLLYIRFGSELIAIREISTHSGSLSPIMKFIHKDHLGSIDVITDQKGDMIGKFQYSPFGERIVEMGDEESTARGFTGHKHYEAFGLLDAGGRYYIPSMGRFVSADPFVQSPDNLQSLNRYSYVQNNPLNNIDPSGFFKIRIKNPLKAVGKLIKDVVNAGRDIVQGVIDLHKNIYDEADRFVNKYGKQILIVAAAAAITYFSAGTLAGFGAAMLTGAAWGAGISAGIAAARGGNFQDILNAGFNGAIMGATAAAAAHSIGVGFKEAGIKDSFGSAGYYGKTAAHGISGGIQSEAAGGSFKSGLLSASISNAFTPANERLFGNPTSHPDNAFQRIAFSSAIGGVAAHAGGGDFTQGAMTAGFVQSFNHEGLFYMASKTFGGLMGLKGLYDMNNYIESGDHISGAGAALSLGGGLVRSVPHPLAQGIGWGMTGVGQAMVHREFLMNVITPPTGPAPYTDITNPGSRNGRNW